MLHLDSLPALFGSLLLSSAPFRLTNLPLAAVQAAAHCHMVSQVDANTLLPCEIVDISYVSSDSPDCTDPCGLTSITMQGSSTCSGPSQAIDIRDWWPDGSSHPSGSTWYNSGGTLACGRGVTVSVVFVHTDHTRTSKVVTLSCKTCG